MSTTIQSGGWIPANGRDRRVLAVALLALVVVVVLALIAVPVVLLHRHYDEHISRMTRQLQTQLAFNAMGPRVAQALESLKARDASKLFLKGNTAALASAELQDQVKSIVESTGGRFISSTGLAHKDDGQYRTVSATFQINLGNANLRRLLHALETQEPYLFVDNLTVRSLTPPGFRAPPGYSEPEVYAQMDVSAVARIAEAATTAPAATPARASGATKS
jgi:general secretion pathway protein M